MSRHEQRPTEVAMRIYERVRQHAKAYPQFLIVDLLPGLMADYGMGKTAATRYVRIAIDVLGIPYDTDRRRFDRRDLSMLTKTREGLDKAKAAGWPNGKPGRYAGKTNPPKKTKPKKEIAAPVASHPWRDTWRYEPEE